MGLIEPTTTAVETQHLYQISRIVSRASEWNDALDEIVPLIRSIIIFDNIVVYIADPQTHHLDVMYARAVGRGRSSEADIAWGEILANRIMDDPQITIETPDADQPEEDRLKSPYMLAIPFMVNAVPLGVVVLIRFGGPPFNRYYVDLADFIAQHIGLLVERQNLRRANQLLENQNHENRLQDDFISTVSHELRTPLGFIKGYSTTLLRPDTTWDPETQQEFLTIIDQETDRLQELIDNMLDSARLQSGTLKMDFQAVRLDNLVKTVGERAKMYHPEFNLHLSYEGEQTAIFGDPKRLSQVLENIFNNSLKYAPGSDVWVKIIIDEVGAAVIIRDQGPGIPQRYLPHLFERFFRNPDNAPSVHGTGLGLFICRKIITAHEGQITVDSQIGQGTTFKIWIPKTPPKTSFLIMSEES